MYNAETMIDCFMRKQSKANLMMGPISTIHCLHGAAVECSPMLFTVRVVVQKAGLGVLCSLLRVSVVTL